jgi:preprotein translocase subunit SecY
MTVWLSENKIVKKIFLGIVVVLLVTIAFVIFLATPGFRTPTKTPSGDQVSVRFPIPIIEAGQTPFYVAQDKD